jgi:predicted ATPase
VLIGRDRELAEVENRAKLSRLVTVVGPGGVGKTALARSAANRIGDGFAMGVRMVDLTRVDDEGVVPGAVANQLGFDSFDALLSSPNDRPIFLLVDNCEHLLDAVAEVIVQVLGACHQPSVLATSRSPLEIPGESIVSLAPLAVPATHEDPLSCPSVVLFLERCRAAGLSIEYIDLGAVVELCRQLDGLPLAIEIAAARARTMSVAEISSRLAADVDVLDRPRFRGDPRHRSVADTIRWSYDLLQPSQARLLDQSAVFAGPFTAVSVAEAVEAAARHSLAADLDELVNASLVTVDTDSVETRYRLLDTVRRFGLDQLRQRDELNGAYDRFADHVLATVRRIVSGTAATWRPSVVRELVASFEDIGEAMRWCLSHDTERTRVEQLCGVLWAVVHQGHADEIAELARRTHERWPSNGSPSAAQVAAVLATAEYATGRPELAVEIATAASERLEAPGPASVILHRVTGQALRSLNDLDGSAKSFHDGAAIGHELGLTAMALELESGEALVAADAGDAESALALLESVAQRSDVDGSLITACWARSALGWVMLRSDPVAARPLIDAALAEAHALDYPIGIAVGLRSRAYADLLAGDMQGALRTASELMHDLIGRGALSNGRLLLDVTAAIAYRAGHPSWEELAATARSLPITTLASAHFELVHLPPTDASPVSTHNTIGAAWKALSELSAEAEVAREETMTAPVTASIRRLGDVCEFTYAGQSTTIRASKGVEDLIRLIEGEGGEVHCLDLIDAVVEEPTTGEVIDAEARRSYEQRIRDLQTEIDEAEDNGDYARSYKHQAELDALIEHLTAALGQGQRTRLAAGSAERARSAVTHRIRGTIRLLGRMHPVLGRHLTHAIKTGTYCSYQPEHPTVWHID